VNIFGYILLGVCALAVVGLIIADWNTPDPPMN
jgi:hypothetical protein